MLKRLSYAKAFMLISLLAAMAGCGGDKEASNHDSMDDSNCPPVAKSGLSAMQRAGGIEAMEKYSKWQTELPPKRCAGSLAAYVPDLPQGYGLPPNVRPPIMMDGHVYLKYVKIPENVTGEALDMINFAQQPQFEFEIAQLTENQAKQFRDWFANNPKGYSEYPVEGRMFYATGGGAWYMDGHKLTGGIGTILANNVMIKFTMPKIYADKTTAQPVAKMFHEIAVKNGQ